MLRTNESTENFEATFGLKQEHWLDRYAIRSAIEICRQENNSRHQRYITGKIVQKLQTSICRYHLYIDLDWIL